MPFNAIQNLPNIAAKSMFEYLNLNTENIYFYFAKSSKWNIADTKLDINSNKDFNHELFKEFLLLYKLEKNNYSLVYERIDWVKNNIFNEYSQSNNKSKCYVLTKDYNIYKCITNNENSPSLYEPNHRTFEIKEYSDGYKWKYLYTLTNIQKRYFLSSTHIPIDANFQVNSIENRTEFNAIPGTIDAVKVIKGGSGYANTDTVTITGDGTGATAKIIAQSGIIKRIVITNPGKNYTKATITISGTGILAEAEPVISPLSGHGSDLLNELNVSSIMINSSPLTPNHNVSAIPKSFDYRKIGLISDYKKSHAELLYSNCLKLRITDSSALVINSELEIDGIKAHLIYKEQILGEHIIYVNELEKDFTDKDFTNKDVTYIDTKNRILEVLHKPSINKNFRILYSENLNMNTCINHELNIIRITLDF